MDTYFIFDENDDSFREKQIEEGKKTEINRLVRCFSCF